MYSCTRTCNGCTCTTLHGSTKVLSKVFTSGSIYTRTEVQYVYGSSCTLYEIKYFRKYESTTTRTVQYRTKVSFITFESKFYFRTKVFYVHVQYVYSTVLSKVLYFRTKVLSKNVSNYLYFRTKVQRCTFVLSKVQSTKVRKYFRTFVRIVPYFEDRYEGNSCTRSPTGRVQLYTYAYVRVT